MSNATTLEEWINTAAGDHPRTTVELDLSGVDFIDSTTIRTLVNAHSRLGAQGRAFRVRGAQGIVARVLKTAGVLDVLTG